jgi:hypothetical protein
MNVTGQVNIQEDIVANFLKQLQAFAVLALVKADEYLEDMNDKL